jgi:hypothetical protein
MDSIDKLLAQIKAEYQESDKPEQPKKQQPIPKKEAALDSLLSEVEAAEPINKQSSQFNQPPAKNAASINSLLSDVKADYEAQDRAEEQLRLEEFKAEKQRQQQLKQQNLEKLQQNAIAWLKQLDPLSSEGIWFEKFAEKYSSKLEAAIDYLQTNESK